ncbi:MAG: nucleoside recognition protein [Clostridiales bacterium]|nr:nucleoside recognition protein [Clostridiales bacterium]
MLNHLWSLMLLSGILWGTLNGTLAATTQGLIDAASEAVSLSLAMLGIMSFWCGILEIGNQAGLIDWLAERLGGILDFLFPGLEPGHPARKPIAVNIVANMLGLGMAATPAGLEAMQKLSDGSDTATDSMCTFLILNVSSLQLIPVSMIAFRSRYGSTNPSAVLGPALAATVCSTAAAVLFCQIMNRRQRP